MTRWIVSKLVLLDAAVESRRTRLPGSKIRAYVGGGGRAKANLKARRSQRTARRVREGMQADDRDDPVDVRGGGCGRKVPRPLASEQVRYDIGGI